MVEPQQSMSFLDNKSVQLVLFGGKGGSGKTTSASATALYLAQLKPERKILIVSTDPAHSLGDSFDCPIGNKVTPIKGVDNLWALEMDAGGLYNNFKNKYGEAIKKIIDRGTILDEEDISELYSLSIPGLDEVMAIIRIADILKSRQYNLVILDTAPTGHTIKLLSLPEQMGRFFDLFDLMLAKHHYLSRHFTGRYKKDETDEFVETVTKDMTRIRMLLESPLTEFVPVTIPEPVSISETERLLITLKKHSISVKNIIVNRAVRDEECVFCTSRRRDQEEHLTEIDQKFAAYNLIKMPLFPHEVRGVEGLKEFAQILFGKSGPTQTHGNEEYQSPKIKNVISRRSNREYTQITQMKLALIRVKGISSNLRPKINVTQHLDISENSRLQFIFFGGKGGVGKTSFASATALRLAKHNPDKKILIFSTDPAHSLSDSFGFPIGDGITPTRDRDNLYALEIDAQKLYEDIKKEYKASIEEVIDKFLGRGVDIKFDREVLSNLVEISPPGLDELMALEKIMEFVENKQYDLYILDTAPTGHLLRFLELPGLVKEWLKTIFRILLKYHRIVRVSKLEEKLVKTAKYVRKIREALTDSERSEFVTVTIPEAMAFAEMERLLLSLRRLKIPCHYIVVNMIVPLAECSFCSSKRKEQRRYVQEIRKKFPEYLVTEVPLFPHEISGINDLTELSKTLSGKKRTQMNKSHEYTPI